MSNEVIEPNSNEYNNDSYGFDSLTAMAKYYSPDSGIKSTTNKYTDSDSFVGDINDDHTLEYDPIMWQSECLERIKTESNVILSSPTGSGKTRVFLEWGKDKKEQSEAEGKKHTIYITAPIKALSNQRFRELQEAGVNVGLETGDIKSVPKNADYICCTQEIYTNKYLEDENATLIMDEFHYIFENGDRARTYIDSLHKSKAQNMLLASATFGDTGKFCNYVNKTSGRNFLNYENTKRITSLEYKGEIGQDEIWDSLVVTFSGKNCENIAGRIREQREESDMPSCQEIDTIASSLKIKNGGLITNCKSGIAYYYGGMLPKEKLFVEKLFEKRLIDTVVGTDALALGVNFPVQKVVFAQLAKYYDGPISKNLFEQLSGRAGRKGYFDEGEVYYCDFGVESYDYDTADLFKEMLERDNEDATIALRPNIKNILSGKTNINDEIEYVTNFSTITINQQDVIDRINEVIGRIERYSTIEEFMNDEGDDSDVNRVMGIFESNTIRPARDALRDFMKSFYKQGYRGNFEEYLLEYPEKRYIRNEYHDYYSFKIIRKKTVEKLEENGSIPSYEELSSMAKYAFTKLYDISRLPQDKDIWETSRYVNPELFDFAKTFYSEELYEKDDWLKSDDPKTNFLFHVFQKLLPDRGYETDECVKKWLAGNIVESIYDIDGVALSHTYEDIKQLRHLSFGWHSGRRNKWHQYADINEIATGLKEYSINADFSNESSGWAARQGFHYNFVSDIIYNTKSGRDAQREVSRIDLLPYSKQLNHAINNFINEKDALITSFREGISNAYFEEFNVDTNCQVFINILKGKTATQIMDDYCRSLSDRLQFRKYFHQLPKKYRKNTDFKGIDDGINDIDDSVLQSERVDMESFASINQIGREGEK